MGHNSVFVSIFAGLFVEPYVLSICPQIWENPVQLTRVVAYGRFSLGGWAMLTTLCSVQGETASCLSAVSTGCFFLLSCILNLELAFLILTYTDLLMHVAKKFSLQHDLTCSKRTNVKAKDANHIRRKIAMNSH